MPIRLVLLDILVPALITRFTHEGRQEDLEKSIEYGNKALALSPQGRPDRPLSVVNLAVAKWTRFVFASRREDIEDSVASLRQVAEPLSSGATIRAVALGRLADALRHRFMSYGALEDLEESIVLGKEALSTCDPHAPSRAMILNSLASSFGQRFGYAGEDEDFNLSMEYIRECHASFTAGALASLDLFVGPTLFLDATLSRKQGMTYPGVGLVQGVLDACPPRNLHRPSLLGVFALSALVQNQESDNPEHLETFFSFTREALSLCPPRAAARPGLLLNLAVALDTCFCRSGEPDTLTQSIETAHAALSLCSYAHLHRHKILEQLWKSVRRIFEQTGDLEVLNKSISYLHDAVALCPLKSLLYPSLIQNLATAFCERSIHTKQVDDVDVSLGYFHHALSLYPAPHHASVFLLGGLGALFQRRFRMTGNHADLDKSVEFFEESLSYGTSDPPFHIRYLLSELTTTLCDRYATITRNIEDMQKSIEYGQMRLSLCPPGHPDHAEALRDLAHTLKTRHLIDGDPEDLEQCINYLEMAFASLSQEASLPPSDFVTFLNTMSALASALAQRSLTTSRHEDLNRSVDLSYKALALCPIGHPSRYRAIDSLAHTLRVRYEINGNLGDLENSIIYLREVLEMESGSVGFLSRVSTVSALASALSSHFRWTRQPDDLRDSIKYSYEALSLCPPGHSGRAAVLFTLSTSLCERFNLTRWLEDLNCSISFLREAISVDQDHKSPYHLRLLNDLTQVLCIRARAEDLKESMRYLEGALHLSPPGHPDRSKVIAGFARYYECRYDLTGEPEDIQKAIDYFREALSLSGTDQSSSSFSVHLANSLGAALMKRCRALQTVEDLDECIDRGHRMLSLNPLEQGHPEHLDLLHNLATSLSERHRKTGNQENIPNAIIYAREGALVESALYRPKQLGCAILWARLAHENSHPSALHAYRRNLELLRQDLANAPTLEMQHELVRNQQSLPLDAAAYAISQGNLELAVEMLEQGRALLWSQVRRLRTPLDQLSVDESLRPLRDTFLEKSRALETISISASPFISISAIGERPDPYGHMLETKRRLSAELDEVIDEIRAKIPDFLRLPSYDRLKAASTEGPVIIVNISRFRSDALILVSGDNLSCVELVDGLSERADDLANNLLQAREALSTAPKRYDRVLRRTLEDLAELVVGPVLEKLKELGVKEGSRIWWCPTSVLSVLPLHAAGPIATSEPRSPKGKAYLPDLYIPSYTPTLTALIEARAVGSARRAEHKGLLGVALLDKSLEAVGKEVEVLRTHFADSDLTLAIEGHCGREAVTAGLAERPWVHFSCHGTLKSGEPLNSAFILSGDERITLLDIIKAGLHRENAELAVLSACHTAEWTPDSATDEALHLAAAMQFLGFKSVVGTMWQLQDEDGPTFAKAFYDAFLKDALRLTEDDHLLVPSLENSCVHQELVARPPPRRPSAAPAIIQQSFISEAP
ncbi:uncharacterized protein PHACADRAFT_202335 [Phanerochaete carnosa HHB-10118-sp]|uniref:CHAT domain-containing protein n=1 Tax=Phanerochaete carnosa (strain HHB-10118-sp) TaxID=650164 RepID=K5VQ42_PHACS|nr:uncharacterized protein PHACADRAFT_202335 [Phanerochaete carnosa HHB-10118-sp]EKM48835.1 hypothetical protein PHACADRAFT_202335 [Phanerochaete carnosa HHB-10118-sp]